MGTCGAAMSGMKMAQAHREGQKCSRMDRVNGMEGGLFILAPVVFGSRLKDRQWRGGDVKLSG